MQNFYLPKAQRQAGIAPSLSPPQPSTSEGVCGNTPHSSSPTPHHPIWALLGVEGGGKPLPGPLTLLQLRAQLGLHQPHPFPSYLHLDKSWLEGEPHSNTLACKGGWLRRAWGLSDPSLAPSSGWAKSPTVGTYPPVDVWGGGRVELLGCKEGEPPTTLHSTDQGWGGGLRDHFPSPCPARLTGVGRKQAR